MPNQPIAFLLTFLLVSIVTLSGCSTPTTSTEPATVEANQADDRLTSATLFLKGTKAASKENDQEAINYFNKAIAINGSSPDYYQARAMSYYGLQLYEKALADLDKASVLDEEGRVKCSIATLRSLIYVETKNLELALENALGACGPSIEKTIRIGDILTALAIEEVEQGHSSSKYTSAALAIFTQAKKQGATDTDLEDRLSMLKKLNSVAASRQDNSYTNESYNPQSDSEKDYRD